MTVDGSGSVGHEVVIGWTPLDMGTRSRLPRQGQPFGVALVLFRLDPAKRGLLGSAFQFSERARLRSSRQHVNSSLHDDKLSLKTRVGLTLRLVCLARWLAETGLILPTSAEQPSYLLTSFYATNFPNNIQPR